MSTYTIQSTQPTIYQDSLLGVVNGVLVRFTIDNYDELHEVRVPKMDATLVKAAIEKVVAERDALASLGQVTKK
jgi:hypothetical protein